MRHEISPFLFAIGPAGVDVAKVTAVLALVRGHCVHSAKPSTICQSCPRRASATATASGIVGERAPVESLPLPSNSRSLPSLSSRTKALLLSICSMKSYRTRRLPSEAISTNCGWPQIAHFQLGALRSCARV